jgi:hypothetical protein
VDTYAKWLPLGNNAGVEQLDAPAAVDHARADADSPSTESVTEC